MKMNIKEKIGRRKLIKRCLETIEYNIRTVKVCVGNVGDQDKWGSRKWTTKPE